ncbi:nuclease [Methanobrevibacter sp.]|uniref:nuclease n=1 Tax=Methanobrevibacter sp. TaxID=66852 RepID=UPI0025CD0F37|nr:nuclease [Methanobrevibacter sp.]MBQ2962006.1 nuclease [Methanobrevibacter sp.]
MSNENQERKVYNLLISKGIDTYDEYEFYKERINSQKDFLWNEYNTEDDELNEDLFDKIDVIVLLYGLYHDNKDICDELIDKSKELDIPLLFVRSYGVEYVIEEIVEKADAVVGWNPHCIVDAIETLVEGEEEWIKPCDIEDES